MIHATLLGRAYLKGVSSVREQERVVGQTLTMGGKMSKHKKSSRSTRSKDRRKEKGPKGASPTPPSGKQ